MIKPLRARYSKIESIVENILNDAEINKPPTPILFLIRRSKIELKKADLGDISGLLYRSSERMLIGYNIKQAKARQRFTIAHEYGHYLLHADIVNHCDKGFIPRYRSAESSEATNVEEIEANFFAASLLMPRSFLIADRAMTCMDSDEGIKKLAKKYKVSGHAMSLRLVNLFGDHRPF